MQPYSYGFIPAPTWIDFDDVLVVPNRSDVTSRKQVSVTRKFIFPASGQKRTLVPVIVSNMDTTGTFEMTRALVPQFRMPVALHKYYPMRDLWHFLWRDGCAFCEDVFVTIGPNECENTPYMQAAATNIALSHAMVNLDAANGHTESFLDAVSNTRHLLPNTIIMAGNVCTPRGTKDILMAGADIVKVGIGSGYACITRDKTGVGYPQVSAILECAEAAHESGGFICSDGGVRSSGDICKALAVGADFVMSGYLFAGTNECAVVGTTAKPDRSAFYRGLASKSAQDDHAGGVKPYCCPEGEEVEVTRKGPAEHVAKDILGGIRSCCAYSGVYSIEDLAGNATILFRNN
jgi:GMP reductase